MLSEPETWIDCIDEATFALVTFCSKADFACSKLLFLVMTDTNSSIVMISWNKNRAYLAHGSSTSPWWKQNCLWGCSLKGHLTWAARRLLFWVVPHLILMFSREQAFWVWHQVESPPPNIEFSPFWKFSLACSCTLGSEQSPTKYCHSIPLRAAPGTYSSEKGFQNINFLATTVISSLLNNAYACNFQLSFN